jgi:ankyrin repeat protein
MIGPCTSSKPSFFEFEAKSKWEAWKALGDMLQSVAQSLYIERAQQFSSQTNQSTNSKYNSASGGISVSTMASTSIPIEPENMTVFDYVKDGNLLKLKEAPHSHSDMASMRDRTGLTLLHWAADKGLSDTTRYLIEEVGCDINSQSLKDQSTALHLAYYAGNQECIVLLLKAGASTNIRDSDQETFANLTS